MLISEKQIMQLISMLQQVVDSGKLDQYSQEYAVNVLNQITSQQSETLKEIK